MGAQEDTSSSTVIIGEVLDHMIPPLGDSQQGVEGLGSFVEIEAIDETGEIGWEKLNRQCDQFIGLFEIEPGDLISESYSDMILNN